MRSVLLAMVVSACATHDGSGNGEIAISNSAAALPSTQASGRASAYFSTGSLDGAICATATTIGACVVRTSCQGDDEPVSHSSAGSIAITGGYPITLVPDEGGLYGVAAVADGRLAVPSASLTAHAAGDQIGAFDLALSSPEPLTVLAPVRTATDVARSSDLAIAWSGLTKGTVAACIGEGADIASSIACTFQGTDGQGVIPAAALAMFGSASGSLAITANATATTQVDGWNVSFTVTDDAAWADGSTGALVLAFHD